MPFFSFIKKLVVASEETPEEPVTTTTATTEPQLEQETKPLAPPPKSTSFVNDSVEKPSIPPPPPPPSSMPSTATSNSSLRLADRFPPNISRTESSTSVYKDFTGTGHADRGHWNDPPSTAFKQPVSANNNMNVDKRENLEGFAIVDGAMTPNGTLVAETSEMDLEEEEIPEGRERRDLMVRQILEQVMEQVRQANDDKEVKKVEDTGKRVKVLLDQRLCLVDDYLVAKLCRLCVFLKNKQYTEALAAHREIIVTPGYDCESKWLVGIKRVIELAQKN
ncbi:hypothetical protein FB645_002790 [Coemansia sp. IMI 203386]|nr:hypothetical protein FB645_002790 [Coemansia sp. IMI 203386]